MKGQDDIGRSRGFAFAVSGITGDTQAACNRPASLVITSAEDPMTTKKSAAKKSAKPKYSKSAGKSVKAEMKARKEGKLRSGKSGKKVTSKKQAIAIGLSKARKAGKKVAKNK
jgi:hypothetical protein